MSLKGLLARPLTKKLATLEESKKKATKWKHVIGLPLEQVASTQEKQQERLTSSFFSFWHNLGILYPKIPISQDLFCLLYHQIAQYKIVPGNSNLKPLCRKDTSFADCKLSVFIFRSEAPNLRNLAHI